MDARNKEQIKKYLETEAFTKTLEGFKTGGWTPMAFCLSHDKVLVMALTKMGGDEIHATVMTSLLAAGKGATAVLITEGWVSDTANSTGVRPSATSDRESVVMVTAYGWEGNEVVRELVSMQPLDDATPETRARIARMNAERLSRDTTVVTL